MILVNLSIKNKGNLHTNKNLLKLPKSKAFAADQL